MTEGDQNLTTGETKLSEEEIQGLLRSLLHKEGTWVDWGQTCQRLQKAGCSPQRIFDETGIQGSQQNQIIVAAQVYDTLVHAEVSEEVKSYFRGPRSDILYEFRILNQEQRVEAAKLAMEKRLDIDGAHEVTRALKDVSRRGALPEGFTRLPGDAVAYLAWKQAREKKEIQERSRLIAKGLQFAQTPSARQQIEKLLTDFTTTPSAKAPLLPTYRLEAEEELARIVPIAGKLPLTRSEIETIPSLKVQEPFRIVSLPANLAVVPLPGWQSVLKAQDPVAFFCSSEQLPNTTPGKSEEVLVLVDRQAREWNINSYFLIEFEDRVEIRWLEESQNTILGQVVLILRPKKIVDENNIIEPWQMDD